SGEVKNDFPLVPADDPELKASGVRRSPSQS
ncbi:acyl-CoA thioesterase, partial [Bacteroides intestinalis]